MPDIEVHSPDSPYYGLPLAKQKLLSMVRRGMKRTPKAILRQLKKPTREVFDKILVTATQALIYAHLGGNTRLDRIRMCIKLFIFYRKTDTWRSLPRPSAILGYDDFSIYLQFKVDDIIDWLYEGGHSVYDSKRLRKELWYIIHKLDDIRYIESFAHDISVSETYQKVVEEGSQVPDEQKKRIYRKRKKKTVDKSPEVCDNVVSKNS